MNIKSRLCFEEGKQSLLLNEYMKYKGINTQVEAAKLFSVNKFTFRNWISERSTLPFNIFEEIRIDFKKANYFKKYIKYNLDNYWGQKKGGVLRRNQISNLKLHYQFLRTKKEKIREQKFRLNKSILKINNLFVKSLIKDKINITHLLATYLLTDGSLSHKGEHFRLQFYTKDKILRDMVYCCLLKESRYKPSIYKDKKEVYSIKVTDKFLGRRLLRLNSSYKRMPSKNQKDLDYFKEIQPSLNFLKKVDSKTRDLCVRLALTTDGYISSGKNFRVALTCYNPSLCEQWIEIFELCGLKSHLIKRKDSWCKCSEVVLDRDSVPLFLKMGGFINGVKISKKSKKYKGLEKNKLLENVLRS